MMINELHQQQHANFNHHGLQSAYYPQGQSFMAHPSE